MNVAQDNQSPQSIKSLGKSLPGQIVLVLQGGGALGAYQVGVYQALHEAGIEPDWVIGTSIGAINASLIAGNAPEHRLARLTEFWKRMEQNPAGSMRESLAGFARSAGQLVDDRARRSRLLPAQSAGAFRRVAYPLGAEQAGYYSTAPLRSDARGARRLRSHQPRHAAPDGRRGECAHQPDALFRQPRRRARCQAHHGVRRAAAGLSGRAHRRRALLGRRHSLEHADRGRVRRQSAPRLADLRGPPLESDGAGAEARWRR